MKTWLIVLGVVAVVAAGVIFVKPPAPVIIVKPEHVFDIGPIGVTNTMFTSWCVVALLVVTSYFVGKNVSVVPSGFSGAIEASSRASTASWRALRARTLASSSG